jgi:hypothetical protein
MGCTTGRGKDDLTHRQNQSIKGSLRTTLTRRFRVLNSSMKRSRQPVEIDMAELRRRWTGRGTHPSAKRITSN